MSSIFKPSDWQLESAFLKDAANGQVVNDDTVARLKVKLVKQVLDSHLFFMRNYAQTVDKHTSELVLMDPFYGQAGLDYTIECQRRLGYAQRVVEIKPRQVGWTTALLSRGVWTCLHPRRNTVLFVPDSEVAEDMMRRVGTIINCLPDWLRPMKRIDRTGLIEFDNPNHRERERDPGLQSRFLCLVPTDFRGASNINMVILSEYAKYNKTMHGGVQEFLDALMSGIAESDNTCVVIDTTPMGHDSFYEPMAMEAIERNPQWVKRWYKKGRRTVQEIADGALGSPDRPQDWVPWFSRWTDHNRYCVVAGTRVNLKHGICNVEDLKVGDQTDLGEVYDTFVFRNCEVLRVTTASGRSVVCTPNHPFMTTDGWVTADKVFGKDVALRAPRFGEEQVSVLGVLIDKDIARLLGHFMSDGCVDCRGRMQFACSDKDTAYDVVYCLTKLFSYFPTNRTTKSPAIGWHNGAYTVRGARKDAIGFLRELGAMSGTMRNVCVPMAIWNSPKDIVREFIRGLFEGDGSVCKSRTSGVSFASIYLEFLRDIQNLLFGFGINGRIYAKANPTVGDRGCNLYLRAQESRRFCTDIGFVSRRKRARARAYVRCSNNPIGRAHETPSLPYETVVSVEDYGRADVYDASVKDSHAFVANGIVVHNTTKDDLPTGELPALTPLAIDELLRSERKIGSREEYGGDQEEELIKVHGATLGNIAWRRNKIDKNPGPDWRYRLLGFTQEFGIHHDSMFVTYGTTPFDPLGLEAIHKQVMDPYLVGKMRDGENGPYLDSTFRSDWEQVRLWSNPTSLDEAFLIAVDLGRAYMNKDADDTFAHVLRRHDQKQVCVYQAKVPPTEVRQQLYLLHRYYNNALMVVETDEGIGYSLVRELYDMGCTNQYYWTRLDKDIPHPTDYMGWETNPKTRPIMQETLVEEVNRRTPDGKPWPGVIIRDYETYRQLTNLERDPNGTIEGSGKTHDDAAIAMMIALTSNRASWHAFTMPRQASEEVDPKTRGGALMEDWTVDRKSTAMYVEPGIGRDEKEQPGDAA
jgi:hypothetical protein